MKNLLSLNLALIALFLATGAQTHKPYKWTDAEGNVHYSQHPPSGSEYERLKIKTPRSSRSQQPATSTSTQDAAGTSNSGGNSKLIKSELAKNKEIREKNCAAAKKNLEIYTIYKRYKDKDGKISRMNDEERLKKIDEAKGHMEEFCD